MTITIYHNPNCGTSRNTLALIRAAGHEPRIVEYLNAPPSRAELASMVTRMDVPVRQVARKKEPLYAELGLDKPGVTDDQILDAMAANPVLINRPIVESDKGIRLCRPSELVNDLL